MRCRGRLVGEDQDAYLRFFVCRVVVSSRAKYLRVYVSTRSVSSRAKAAEVEGSTRSDFPKRILRSRHTLKPKNLNSRPVCLFLTIPTHFVVRSFFTPWY